MYLINCLNLLMELNSVLELIVTNKDEIPHKDKINKSKLLSEANNDDNNSSNQNSNSYSDDASSLIAKNTPYFEVTDRYVEALSQFVSRFDLKEKLYQDRICDLEAHLKLRDEEFQKLKFDLRQFKQDYN